MEILKYNEIFKGFDGRDEALRRVVRYHIYSPMYYRSNLVTHSKHVLWLLQDTLPYIEHIFGSSFDTTKAQIMATIHDDPEIIMGDVQAGHKNKMSPEELKALAETERQAIVEVAKNFPKTILGYSYESLLHEANNLTTLEAKFLKFIDRFDAFGESLHELFAGNKAFAVSVLDKKYGIIGIPTPFYISYLTAFPEKTPEFKKLFQEPHILFTAPSEINLVKTVEKHRPHSPTSLAEPSGYPHYDFWKKVVLESGDTEEISLLHVQREF